MGSPQFRGYLIFMLYAVALAFRSLPMILVLTLSLFVFKRLRPKRTTLKEEHPKLTKEEKDIIIADWMPEPLVEEYSPELIPEPRIIQGKIMKYIEIDGKHCLNMASNDFLSLVGNKQIEDIAQQTIYKYGVGACGPRNFYGTVDVHLDLEKKLAQFLGCEEAILYSYGFATISSAIPAYSKPGDIIFADKGVNFAIQKGLQASKSKIVWFEHNDMEHLESLLKEQAKIDKKNPRKAAKIRRCIIVEGIYAKTAAICPLPRLVELKWKYKVRIFMDESLSFCVVGRNGKGVTEHFGVDVIDVDLIVASLENALATTGGFCAGRSFVIGHQRLSGLGYCFSASLPPLLATAASEALDIIQTSPHIFDRLQQNSIRLHQKIIDAIKGSNYELIGSEISPLKYVAYSNDQFAEIKLNHLVEELNNNEIFVTRAHYLVDEEMFAPRKTMKIACRVDLTLEEIDEFGQKILLALKNAKE